MDIITYIAVLLLAVIGMTVSSLVISALFGIDFSALAGATEFTDKELLGFKFMQLMSSAFIFILPPLVWVYFFVGKKEVGNFFGLNKKLQEKPLLWAVLFMLSIFPALSVVMFLNQQMVLPSFMADIEAWMRQQEQDAAALTQSFLQAGNVFDLLFNIVVIALIPAIGEELTFRGIFQNLLQKISGNPHLAIWVSAAIFSFIHFQFFGFFPRWFIGVGLGYLYWWSGNLWYPIIGHFVNNAFQVVLAYWGVMEVEDTALPQTTQEISILFVSGLISLVVALVLAKWFRDYFNARRRKLE